MSHWIIAERADLKSRLIAAGTLAGTRVESEQNDPACGHPTEAADVLPKLCVYIPEVTGTGIASSTAWPTRATIVIDCWVHGVAAGGLTAQEVGADKRDRLVAEVLGALTGSSAWLSRWQTASQVSEKRAAFVQGSLVMGAAQVRIEVETTTDHGLADAYDTNADALENVKQTLDNTTGPTGEPLVNLIPIEQSEEATP